MTPQNQNSIFANSNDAICDKKTAREHAMLKQKAKTYREIEFGYKVKEESK